MLTLLVVILAIIIFGKIAGFALKATWGLTKLLVTFLLFPIIIVLALVAGLIPIAILALIVIGIISLIFSAA